VTKLGRSVDKLELDLFQISPGSVHHQTLTNRQYSLLRSGHATLEHQEIVLDDTIMGEATQWCDGLVGRIRVGGTVLLVTGSTNTINLLVEFGTMMVAV